jgi:c-di-GMP-binding flagellar brake protein YcgR
MGIDQRKYIRTPIQSVVQYSDLRLFFTEFMIDLSLGGMRIVASKPIEPGTKVIISTLAQSMIKVKGIVVWSKKSIKNKFKYEIGVQFVELSQDHKSQIADIIASMCWEMNS